MVKAYSSMALPKVESNVIPVGIGMATGGDTWSGT